MKKLIILLSSLVVIVGAGIYFIMPSNLDWDGYVQAVEKEIKTQTGLALRFTGKPQFVGGTVPLVRIEQPTLSNVPGAEAILMMKADSMEIQLDRAQIFKRRIRARKVVLHSPVFNFERLNDGKWNWQIAFFERRVKNEALGFENLMISKGKAEIHPDKYSATVRWNNINAELLADSSRGPFYFDGIAGTSIATVGFSMRIDKFDAGSSPNVTMRITHAPSESTMSFVGKYSLDPETKGDLTGSMSFEVRKTAALFSLFSKEKLPDSVFMPLVGSMKIAENSQRRERVLSDFVFKYGQSAASGSVRTRFLSADEAVNLMEKKEEVVLEEELILRDPSNPSVAVNVDQVKTETKIAEHLLPSETEVSFAFSKLMADPFVAAAPDFVKVFEEFHNPRSKDKVTVNLLLDSVEYRKVLLRQGEVKIETSDNGLRLTDSKIRFPGETDVKADGSLQVSGDKPLFNVLLSAESNNIGDFLNWVGYPVLDNRPADIWHLFKGSVNLTLSEGGVVLKDIRLYPDRAEITGSAAVRYGSRPRIAVKANVRNFDAKAYFPEADKLVSAFVAERKDKTFAARVRMLSDKLNPLNKMELSMNVAADLVDFTDFQAKNAALDFSVQQGRLVLNNLSSDDLWNGTIALSGVLEHLGSDLTFMPMNVSLTSSRQNEFLHQSGFSWPLQSLNDFTDLTLRGKINGTADKFTYTAEVLSGDMTLKAAGDFSESGGEKTGQIRLSGADGDFRHFVSLFTKKYRPLSPKPGNVETSANISFGKNFIKVDNLSLLIPDAAEMQGNAVWALGGDRPNVQASLAFSFVNLKKVFPSLTDSIVAGEETVLTENVFQKDGALVDLEKISFSRNNFNLSFLGNYDAKIDITADRMSYGRSEFFNASGLIELTPSFAEAKLYSAVVNGATLTLSAKISPENSDYRVEGQMNLSEITIPRRAFNSELFDVSQMDGGSIYLNGVGTGRTPFDVMRSFEGTGFAGFRSALITGFSYKTFPEIFKTASPENIGLLSDTVMRGRTPVSKLLSNLVFENGTLKSAKTQLTYEQERTDIGTAAFNLTDGSFTADWSFSLKAFNAPDFRLQLNKQAGKDLELTENVAETARGFIVKNEEEKARKKEAQENAREARAKKAAVRKQFQRNKLVGEEASFSNELDALDKRIEALQEYQDVFQAARYTEQLLLIQKEAKALQDDIRTALASDDVSVEKLQDFREKITTVLINKKQEIDENYNAALLKGVKGHVYAALTEGNSILKEIIRLKTEYPRIEDLAQCVQTGMELLNKLKGFDERAEMPMNEAERSLLQTETKLTLEAVKKEKETADDMIKKYQQAEEEKMAKVRAEEEARLKAEAEAKAAEEARLKAEEEARADALKKKQETIHRRTVIEGSPWYADVDETSTKPASGVLSFGGTSKPVSGEEMPVDKPIIRRR